MTNLINQVKMDEEDPRYKTLKENFTEEIKKRFYCEDNDAIVNYVFNYVFESKNTKENAIKEMKELFNDKSDEIINYLWSQIEKIYGPSQGSNDLLDEIYNEKNENAAKKFPSKIVNPNVDNNKPVKPLFTSAVERVRDERRRESGRDYRESGRYNKYDRDYRGDYRNRRDYYDGRRDRQGGDSRTMNVGSKKIVLKSKVSRSRSGSKEKERERSREREGDLQTEQDYPPYRGEQYYPPYRGGYFNMRRFPRGGGRFMRFMQPRFIDSRRLRPGANANQKKDEDNVTETSEVTMQGEVSGQVEPTEQKVPIEGGEEKKEEFNKKKIRCKKWPHCKVDNCEFSHPTETCPYFPTCRYGDKCVYIHPNIPCKYGFYCTRLGCAYSHPAGYNPGMFQNMMVGGMAPMNYGHPKYKNAGHGGKPQYKAKIKEESNQNVSEQQVETNPENN